MSSYRFCRTDDIALLVDAWNRCGLPHDPGALPLTVPEFKQEIRELGLWCSSCMVAFDGSEPVGVLIGCKRPPTTLVQRLAVHPDHVRRGHGRHLLTSLSAKLAILGPKELVAEIPAGTSGTTALFDACGWRVAHHFVDLSVAQAEDRTTDLAVHEVTLEDLGESALPVESSGRSWERSRATIAARAARLRGLALASGERVEASVLYAPAEGGKAAVWNVAYERDAAGEAALAALLREVGRREQGDVVLPRVGPDEIDVDRLDRLGLTAGALTSGYVSAARPG